MDFPDHLGRLTRSLDFGSWTNPIRSGGPRVFADRRIAVAGRELHPADQRGHTVPGGQPLAERARHVFADDAGGDVEHPLPDAEIAGAEVS